MGFLSGLGRTLGLRGQQPQIQNFGQPMGGMKNMGGGFAPDRLSPFPGQDQMGEIASMFGGGSAPAPWTQPMMGKPQGGFNLGQAAGQMGQMLGGQQQEQMRPSPFSWFGQFQPWR